MKRGPARGDRFTLDRLLDALALAIVVAFAGCVIAVNAGPHRIGGLDAETDFYGGYAPAAADLAHGRWLTAAGKLPPVYGFVGPLFPTLLAMTTPLAGGAFPAALLLSLAGALATMLLWGSRLRALYGAPAGLAVVTLLATNAVFFRQGYWVTTDAVAVAFQSLAMWLLLRATIGWRRALIAGAAAALAFLTRYTSVWLLPAGIVALALPAPGPTPWRERGLRGAAFLGGFALLALPWIVFARTHGGTVQFHQLLLFDLYSTRDHMPWDEFLSNVWPRFANNPMLAYSSDPGGLLRHVGHNLVAHFGDDMRQLTGRLLMLAALGGTVLAGVRRERAALLVAQATLWSYLALVPAGYNDRYALAVLPGYAALAAYAISAPFRIRNRASRVMRAAAALALVLAGVTAARASLQLQRDVLMQQPLEALECARTLRALAHPGERVIARKPHVGWLAGLETEAFPASDDLAGLSEASRRGHARWLYVSASEAMLRPRTAFLLDSTAAIPGLTLRTLSLVPMRMEEGFVWPRIGILYEIGDGFGREPDGFQYPAVRGLHTLRGLSNTMPNAQNWLRLATAELAFGDTTRARAAWRTVARIDPQGAATFLARAGGDTLAALAGAR